MKQKEAIQHAITVIKNHPEELSKNIRRDVLDILLKLSKKDNYIKWTKESVEKALQDWKTKNGRNPTVTDLKEINMPKGETFKRIFGMLPATYLRMYYPSANKKKPVTKYSLLSPEEYLNIFITQYNKHKPTSSKEYDKMKDVGTPCWATTAHYCGLQKWLELLDYAKLKKFTRNNPLPIERKFTVTVNSPSYDKMVKLLEEQKEALSKMSNYKE